MSHARPSTSVAVHLACVFMTGVLSACDAAPTAGVAPEPQPPAAAPQQQTAARVVVQPERATLVPGDTLPASAVAQDSSGSALPGRVVLWASTDTNIAVVSGDGKIGARSAGRVSIVAIADTARGVIDVEVLPPPADTIVTPPPPPPVTPTPSFTEIVRGVRPRGFGQGSYTLLAPAGGRSLWVAPDGNDASTGSSDAPFRTITRAAQVAAAGDVVTIRAGSYNESVVVANSGTPDRRIVFQAERRGEVVLTGPGRSFRPATWSGGVQNTGQLYVTVRGLVFRAYAGTNSVPPGPDFPAALKMARGWLAEDCLFDRAGWTAISIEGNDAVVARSTIQYSHMYALSAWAPANGAESPTDPRYKPLDGIQLVDLVLRGNHTDATAQTATNAAFSSKFMATRGTLLDNIESYENVGPGFWFDGRNSHFTVRNSYFHHNRDFGATEAHNGRGLNLEINWAPGLVERNVFIGNAGTAVAVTNSQGVEVRDNLMVGNLQCVTLVNAARGTTSSGAPLFPTRDIGIFGNSCKDWKVTGAMHTWGGSFEPPAEMNIRADRNVYEPVTSRTLVWWQELGGVTTLSAARSTFGWEANGSIAPVPWP